MTLEVFRNIYTTHAWGNAGDGYFSGKGSFHSAQAIIDFLQQLTVPVNLVDLGCGDFRFGKQLVPHCKSYIGCDLVPEVIEQNFTRNETIDFRILSLVEDELPKGNICLIRQVLQHLDNKSIQKIIDKCVETYDMMIITEHIPKREFMPNIELPSLGQTRLDREPQSGVEITMPPFNYKPLWRIPIETVEDGYGYVVSVVYGNK